MPGAIPEWLDRSPGRSGELERRWFRPERLAGRPAAGARRQYRVDLGLRPVRGRLHGEPVPCRALASRRRRRHRRRRTLRLRRGRDALVCALVRAHRHRLLGHRALHGRQPPGLGHSCKPDPRGPGPCARPIRPHRSAAGDSSCPRICLHQHRRRRRQVARRRGRRGALCKSRRAQVELCARAADGCPACLRHRGERRQVRQGGPGLHHRLRLRPGRCHPAPHLPRRDGQDAAVGHAHRLRSATFHAAGSMPTAWPTPATPTCHRNAPVRPAAACMSCFMAASKRARGSCATAAMPSGPTTIA